MKRPKGGPKKPRSSKAAGVRDRLARIAAYSAPVIVAFQGTAFAANQRPDTDQIHLDGPIVDPTGMAVIGTAVASIGAYRLMKARKRADRSKADDQKKEP